jgi:hypothetical protein
VVDGDDLVLTGSGPPPSSLLDLLKRHKPKIMALLCLMSGTSMLTKVNLERMAKAAYHRNLELSWPGLPPRALAGAAHETDDPRRPANLAKTTCQESRVRGVQSRAGAGVLDAGPADPRSAMSRSLSFDIIEDR